MILFEEETGFLWLRPRPRYGIKFFYEQTLKQDWPTLRLVRPAREWKLACRAATDAALNYCSVRRCFSQPTHTALRC